MKTLSVIKKHCKSYRKAISSAGFNMLEIVIGVGLILILSAGGIVVYKNVTNNTKIAAVESAADTVFNAATAYDLDGDATTKAQDAADEFMASQKNPGKIIVTVTKNGV